MNTSTVGTRRLLGLGVIAAIGAASVNAAIYGIGRAAGLSFVASTTAAGPQHILLQHVVSLTHMTFGAGLVAVLIADKFRRPSLRAAGRRRGRRGGQLPLPLLSPLPPIPNPPPSPPPPRSPFVFPLALARPPRFSPPPRPPPARTPPPASADSPPNALLFVPPRNPNPPEPTTPRGRGD